MGLSFLNSGLDSPTCAGERFGEHAVLRPEVLVKQPSEHALVVDERREALGDLSVLRVEEAPEHSGDRRLLLLDVSAELAVDVGHEGVAHVLQLRLLRCGMCVVERPQADAPRIDDQLLSLRFVEVAEEREAVGASVADVGGDLVERVDDGGFELRRADHVGHDTGYRMSRANLSVACLEGPPLNFPRTSRALG